MSLISSPSSSSSSSSSSSATTKTKTSLSSPPLSLTVLYLILAFACVSSNYHWALCDQPVFVLETSDSESVSSETSQSVSFQSNEPSSSGVAPKRDNNHNSNHNTQIITDDNSPSSSLTQVSTSKSSASSQPSESQVVVIERRPATNSEALTNKQPAEHQHQSNNREAATVRRLDETNQKLQNTRSANVREKTKSTTTANPNLSFDNQQSAPKTEERLLISITSEEDEYKPPQRQVIASTGGFDEVQPTTGTSYSQQHSQQQHKKKPAITISIQDNSNKQGGSGTPSVILRPSENGQSIIISTLGSSSIEADNNKYNPNKPAISIVSSNGNSINSNNEQPYRDPVNEQPPIQSNVHNHHSSTHRPITNSNSDYSQPANRPIVSTLVDQPRPPVNVINQQRPPVVSLNEDYEPQSTRPSTQVPTNHNPQRPVPTRPPNQEYGSENSGSGVDGGDLVIPVLSSSKYPLNEKNCGVLHETKIVGGDEADPNDFQWMAAIVKSRPSDGEVRPFCGGSLITRRHILTAAHCLEGLAPRDVLVRLGSYDFDDSTASPLSNDYAIDQFRKPAQYSKKTHVADIAIMRLKTPLQLSDNYRTVCMPQARRSYVGALGTVTGYGSQSQTFRRATPKLRQVTVPIWENRKCSAVYKKNLTESFLCAGYEEGGKDACQGDSGGPLMTDGPNDRTIVVGVVSFGIGCGSPGYPGVYTRISTYLDWIEENTRE